MSNEILLFFVEKNFCSSQEKRLQKTKNKMTTKKYFKSMTKSTPKNKIKQKIKEVICAKINHLKYNNLIFTRYKN